MNVALLYSTASHELVFRAALVCQCWHKTQKSYTTHKHSYVNIQTKEHFLLHMMTNISNWALRDNSEARAT